jgi:hypothetical protein
MKKLLYAMWFCFWKILFLNECVEDLRNFSVRIRFRRDTSIQTNRTLAIYNEVWCKWDWFVVLISNVKKHVINVKIEKNQKTLCIDSNKQDYKMRKLSTND